MFCSPLQTIHVPLSSRLSTYCFLSCSLEESLWKLLVFIHSCWQKQVFQGCGPPCAKYVEFRASKPTTPFVLQLQLGYIHQVKMNSWWWNAQATEALRACDRTNGPPVSKRKLCSDILSNNKRVCSEVALPERSVMSKEITMTMKWRNHRDISS